MYTTITNSEVKINQNGQVEIFSSDFSLDDVKQLLQRFEKRVPGRFHMNKEGKLLFEPYQAGQNATTIQLKEQVGQTVVTRSPKAVKFALSLPITMTQHQMIMAVIEQSTLLAEALRNGLYERMVKGDASANQAA